MAMLAAKLNSGVSSSIGSPGGAVTSITSTIKLKYRGDIRIGTWNVKTMSQGGKIHNAIKEMTQMKLNILGVSEMRWPRSGSMNIQDHQIYYSGTDNDKHELGVGIILTKKMARCVDNFIPISPRVMLVQLRASPVNINIIQVYAPTSDRTDEEVEELYTSINQVIKNLNKQEILIVMGDFNARIGAGRSSCSVGPFGLGKRNERGDLLETFAEENQLAVMNTWFKLHPRRLYTWKSPADKPGKIVRNQIDYILINRRYRNSCTYVKTYPGADINSDHVPLVGNFKVRMKKIKTKTIRRYDLRKLKEPLIQEAVKNTLNEKLKNGKMESVKEGLDTIRKTAKEIKEQYLKKDHIKRKSWMTDEILELMEQRKRNKDNSFEYKRIHTIIRRKTREAKEKEKEEQCQEIEYYQSRYDTFNIHRKVKEVAGKVKNNRCSKITDQEGNLVISKDQKKKVWEQYLKDLFHDIRARQEPTIQIDSGPEILPDEVSSAIQQMKNGKAPGLDEVPAELLKLLEEDQIKTVTKIFNSIYSTGEIPDEWLKSEFIALPKKPGSKICSEYRTISLMSHLLKLFLKVIHKRIYRICEEQIGPNQFGFVNAVGTREALFSVQVLFQKCRDVSCDVFACLIDYKKAFDRVRHDQMIDVLKKTGMDGKDLRIIANLYWNQSAVLRVDGEHTEQVKILRGVRQGCVISPLIFNLYSEHIFKEALKEIEEGISINGLRLNNLRYADDTIVFADTLEGLQKLMDKITETSKQYGLDINTGKTKFMIISKKDIKGANLYINQARIERVSQYNYLGTIINELWDNSQEIRCRIGKAKSTFLSMRQVFKSHSLSLEMKKRLLKCYVYSVLLYGVETWTLKQETISKLQAFELWLYRRILKIPWTQKVTNEEVLRRMKTSSEIIDIVKCRKLQYLGHIMRNKGRYELLQCILQGKIAGKRAPGRRRISWLANLRAWFGKSSTQLFRIATNKIIIARMIANVRNGQAP